MSASPSSFQPLHFYRPSLLQEPDKSTESSRVTPPAAPPRTGFITPTPYKGEATKDKSEAAKDQSGAAKGSSSFNQFRAYQDSDSEEELAGLGSTAPWTETFRESHVVQNFHQNTHTIKQSAKLKSRGRDEDGDGDGGRDKKQNTDPLVMHLMCTEILTITD